MKFGCAFGLLLAALLGGDMAHAQRRPFRRPALETNQLNSGVEAASRDQVDNPRSLQRPSTLFQPDRYADERYEAKPYSFEYSAEDAEGSHSHQQSSDGRSVTGQYWIQLADGRQRVVKYVADENGYRAEITTNELGTESKDPADVVIQSSAPTGPQAANENYTPSSRGGRISLSNRVPGTELAQPRNNIEQPAVDQLESLARRTAGRRSRFDGARADAEDLDEDLDAFGEN